MAAEVGFAVYDGHLLLASFIGSLGAVGIGHSGTTVLVPIPYGILLLVGWIPGFLGFSTSGNET